MRGRVFVFIVTCSLVMVTVAPPASAGFGAEGNDGNIDAWVKVVGKRILDGSIDADRPSGGGKSDVFVTSRELSNRSRHSCADLSDSEFDSARCQVDNIVCIVRDAASGDGDGFVATEVLRVDNRPGRESETLLDYECRARGGTLVRGGQPVVVTVTLEDFASMPVQPLVASAGPPEGWLPVNMVNVLYAESETQTMDMTLLGTPVQVRAIPVSYHWDLGDGNTITTLDPGAPYPSEQVSATYTQEGWYDVTLTTTFSGQFSVAGGAWQDIEGTIEVASEPIAIFSKSLESRLVNGDVPIDEDEDPWVPERTAETEGPKDPEATHREI